MQDHVVVDLQHDDPQSGDIYVLCSDGLSGMVSDGDIRQIVADTEDIRDACRQLIQRANDRGGEDNITAVLIQIESSDDAAVGPAGDSAASKGGDTKDGGKVAVERPPTNGAGDASPKKVGT
jgi:protein phosphatase